MYDRINGLIKASRVLCYLFLTLFIVGWFSSGQQLLTAEMIFVLQYAFCGLFTANGLNLSMNSFK